MLVRGRWKGLVLGNYVLLEKLGQGGMGTVFKARHRRMSRVVCLKVLHASHRKSPGILERFRREAQTVAALQHPNIVVAHDADEADGIPFLVMEFIQGSDLAQRVAKVGPLPSDEAVDVVLADRPRPRPRPSPRRHPSRHQAAQPAGGRRRGPSRSSTWAWPASTAT